MIDRMRDSFIWLVLDTHVLCSATLSTRPSSVPDGTLLVTGLFVRANWQFQYITIALQRNHRAEPCWQKLRCKDNIFKIHPKVYPPCDPVQVLCPKAAQNLKHINTPPKCIGGPMLHLMEKIRWSQASILWKRQQLWYLWWLLFHLTLHKFSPITLMW